MDYVFGFSTRVLNRVCEAAGLPAGQVTKEFTWRSFVQN